MTKFSLDAPQQPPQAGITPPARRLDLDRVYVEVGGSIATIRQEVDDAYEDMKQFHNMEPDEITRRVSGHSARLSEVRVRIQRVEDFLREWRNIRTREIEPCLEELREQHSMASRRHAYRVFDYQVETGGPT